MHAPGITALALFHGAEHAPASVDAGTVPTLEALGWEHIAHELRAELAKRVRTTPVHRLGRVAFVVREDGVEVLDRDELATHYRRHGLRDLVRRVKAAPTTRSLVVLEGDEVAVLSYDVTAWLATVIA